MRVFTRVLTLIVALMIIVATIVFILENRQAVSLVFFGWSAPQLSLAIPVIVALLVGMLIGPLLGWMMKLRKKNRYSARSL
jgi:uncharacterized integral membrane protein